MTTTPLEVHRSQENGGRGGDREWATSNNSGEDDDDASAVCRRLDIYLRVAVEKSLLVDSLLQSKPKQMASLLWRSISS